MPLQFESVSQGSGQTASIVVPAPAGIAVGDLLVGIFTSRVAGGSTHTLPSGFVGKPLFTPAFGVPDTTLASKIADAADVAASDFTWIRTGAAGFASICIMMRFSGADLFNPIDIHGFQGTTGGTVATCPSVVATVINTLIVRLNVSQSNSSGAHSGSGISGHTEQADLSQQADAGTGSHVIGMSVNTANALQLTIGAVGVEVISVAGLGTNPNHVGLTFAIAPALSGAVGGPIQLPGERMERGVELAPGYKVPVPKGIRIKNPVERMDDPWKALKRIREEDKEEEKQ